ncbi:hypothetical protein OROMI_013369 [Orobanche minor]
MRKDKKRKDNKRKADDICSSGGNGDVMSLGKIKKRKDKKRKDKKRKSDDIGSSGGSGYVMSLDKDKKMMADYVGSSGGSGDNIGERKSHDISSSGGSGDVMYVGKDNKRKADDIGSGGGSGDVMSLRKDKERNGKKGKTDYISSSGCGNGMFLRKDKKGRLMVLVVVAVVVMACLWTRIRRRRIIYWLTSLPPQHPDRLTPSKLVIFIEMVEIVNRNINAEYGVCSEDTPSDLMCCYGFTKTPFKKHLADVMLVNNLLKPGNEKIYKLNGKPDRSCQKSKIELI